MVVKTQVLQTQQMLCLMNNHFVGKLTCKRLNHHDFPVAPIPTVNTQHNYISLAQP